MPRVRSTSSLCSIPWLRKIPPLDLHIGSVIIRHGAIAYNQRDVAARSGVFSTQHIGVRNLSAHIVLNHLTDNDIHLLVKKISLTDKSGLELKNLSFKLDADKQKAKLSNFILELPHSSLQLEDLLASYRTDDKGKLISESLQFEGGIKWHALPPSSTSGTMLCCLAPISREPAHRHVFII